MILCTSLAIALMIMALAVAVQALAVLLIAAVAASAFLPHPLQWYVHETIHVLRDSLKECFADHREDKQEAPYSQTDGNQPSS